MVRPGGFALVLLSLSGAGAATTPAQEPSPPATTGALRGRVSFLREPAVAERRPSISDLGMPAPRALPNQRVAVVYLETAPRGAFEEREGPPAVLDQRAESFAPHVLAITTGTTVEFRNSDTTYHNVFSLSRVKSFDLGRYPPGASRSVRFDRPGIVRVFCEIHSHMSAFVLVFAHRYFAVTDAAGEYRIEGIPPGAYTVRAWNPVLEARPRAIRIPEDGGEVELDFSLS